MPITNLKIKNCKSLKDIKLSIDDVNCLIGKNGTGKSNIIEVIKYFYDNLDNIKVSNDLYDKNNPYSNYIEITITYNINQFLKISNKKSINSYLLDKNLHSIFKAINKLDKKYAKNNLINLTLKQYKNNVPEWSIDNYDDRVLIKNLFPIYFVDTRNLNLTNWEELWTIIGDLSRIKQEFIRKMSYKDIDDIISEICGKENHKTIKYIKNEFKQNDITINKFSFKEIFIHLLQLSIAGESFNYKEENLNYFSDGINSYNYLNIMVNLISKLSERKLKDPLIVLDEPEIGLHPSYIDDFVNNFSEKIKNIKILLSTHSPRLIRNIVRENFDYNMCHLSLEKNYTKINEMKKMSDNDDRIMYRLSEAEPSFYFSRCIVFVEGSTELELFSNRNLLDIFPNIKKVDFFEYADDVLYKIIHPNMQNFAVPYIILTDLDKVLTNNNGEDEFSFNHNEFVNPIKNNDIEDREKFYYGTKRKLYYLRKRIKKSRKEEFSFKKNWYYTKRNSNFESLKNSILEYCLYYNIFTVSTTIEGVLINRANYDVFYNWLKKQRIKKMDKQKLKEIYNFKNNVSYKVTVLRLIVNGKYDNLVKIISKKDIDENIDTSEAKKIYNYIYEIKFSENKKANGWITSFLNHFFSKYEKSERYVKQYFPELYSIINNIKKKLKMVE